MYVEAICPLCFASHVVPEDMRGETYRCEECEEEFIISKKAKRTSKKPSKLRQVKAAEEVEEVAPVESADVLPAAKLAEPPAKKARPRADDEEVLDIPDDAVQGGAPVVKTTPAAKRRREEDEEENDRPKKRRREDDDEDDRPRRRPPPRSGAPVGLIVGLVAGGVMLLGLCGGAGAWWLLSDSEEKPQQAQVNNPPPNNAQPKLPENAQPPKKDPPRVDPPKAEAPPVRPPKVDPPKPDPAKPWAVKADPPANPVKMPANFKKEIPAPGAAAEVVFPTAPSPFVAIGSNLGPGDQRQVWNLQTGEMTGKVVGVVQSNGHPVLSADGQYLAFLPLARRSTVEVWAPASGKMVTASVGGTRAPDLLEFAGPDKLLIGRGAGANMTVKVVDPTTGLDVREFTAPRPLGGGRDAFAVSPGGAYLALIDRENLHVYDVKTGTLVGERPVPRAPGAAASPCRGLSFSPDGGELAAVFFGIEAQMVCWDVARGDVVSDTTFPKAQPQAPWMAVYKGHTIDWVGDRRGWLVYGYTFVDRNKKGSATFLPEPPAFGSPIPRHLVGTGHAATLVAGAKPTEKVLTVSAFDPDKPQ